MLAAGSAGTYAAASTAAGQVGEMLDAQRQMGNFDVRAILTSGGTAAASALIGAIVGGALSSAFRQMCGSYLARATPQLLRELAAMNGLSGELPRDFFMTTGQRYFTEFMSNVGSNLVTATINRILPRLLDTRQTATSKSVTRMIFEAAVDAGFMTLFIAFLGRVAAGNSGNRNQNPNSTEASSGTPGSNSRNGTRTAIRQAPNNALGSNASHSSSNQGGGRPPSDNTTPHAETGRGGGGNSNPPHQPTWPDLGPGDGRQTLPGIGPSGNERPTLPGIGPGGERQTLPGMGPVSQSGNGGGTGPAEVDVYAPTMPGLTPSLQTLPGMGPGGNRQTLPGTGSIGWQAGSVGSGNSAATPARNTLPGIGPGGERQTLPGHGGELPQNGGTGGNSTVDPHAPTLPGVDSGREHQTLPGIGPEQESPLTPAELGVGVQVSNPWESGP